jgi:hypothetical protein
MRRLRGKRVAGVEFHISDHSRHELVEQICGILPEQDAKIFVHRAVRG